jgi:predicted esterase
MNSTSIPLVPLPYCCLLLVALIPYGCIKLDFFLFETIEADTLSDYHELPLYQGENPPDWINTEDIQREIYLEPHSGTIIPIAELNQHSEYIHGVFLPAPQDCPESECPLVNEGYTFLYQHGNSGSLFRYWYRALALWHTGSNVFIYTYRGYGLSKGEATGDSILEDADTAATYIQSRTDINVDKLIAYGYSMGAITTSYLVGMSFHKTDFLGVILESGLDSKGDILQLSMGVATPSGFIFEDSIFDGPYFIQGLQLPILHIHGQKDRRVVIKQAWHYYDVLQPLGLDYTYYLGSKVSDNQYQWLKEAAHRNIPIYPFKAEYHIADYWDDPANPGHCCLHPDEFQEAINQSFLQTIGKTSGDAMVEAYHKYIQLISQWVLHTFS